MCDVAQRLIAEARNRVLDRMARECPTSPSYDHDYPTTPPRSPNREVDVQNLISPPSPPRHDPQVYQQLQRLSELSRNPVSRVAVDCPPPMPPIRSAYEDPEVWRAVQEFDPIEYGVDERDGSPSNCDLLHGLTEEVNLTGGVEDILSRARHRAMLRAGGLGTSSPPPPQQYSPRHQLSADDTRSLEDETFDASPPWENLEAEFRFLDDVCLDYTQAGSSHTQAGPSYTQAGPSHTRAGPSYTQAGPSHTQAGPSYTQAGPSHTQAGPSNAQAGPCPAHQGPSHIQAGPSHTQSMQCPSGSEPQFDEFGLPYRRYPHAERRRAEERRRLVEERRRREAEAMRLQQQEQVAEEPPRETRGPSPTQRRPRPRSSGRPTRASPPSRAQAGPPPRTQTGPPPRTQTGLPPRMRAAPPQSAQACPSSTSQAGPSRTRTTRPPPMLPARGKRAAEEAAAKRSVLLESQQKRTKYQPPKLKSRPPSKPPTKPKAPRGLDERVPQRIKGPDPTRAGYYDFGADDYFAFDDYLEGACDENLVPRDDMDVSGLLPDPCDTVYLMDECSNDMDDEVPYMESSPPLGMEEPPPMLMGELTTILCQTKERLQQTINKYK